MERVDQDDARIAVAAGIEEQLAGLRQFDLLKRLFELCLFVGLWPCGAALTLHGIWNEAPFYMVAGIGISAISLNAFVLLLHEAMHRVLFASPWWNRWAGVLLGAPLLISMTAYQVMHIRHHNFLGDPRDPDDYGNYSERRWLVWLMHFVRLSVGAFLYLALIPLMAWKNGTAADRRCIVQEYCLLMLIYAAAAWWIPAELLLWGWGVPVILVAYMTNIRGFAQHGITEARDPFLASRTMRPNRLVSFLMLHENYHLEHHLFPEVPSYHLPRLHALIWSRLPRAVTGRSYLGFLGRFLYATMKMDNTPIGLIEPASEERYTT